MIVLFISLALALIVMWWADWWYNAKDYQWRIRRISRKNYRGLISILDNRKDLWHYYWTYDVLKIGGGDIVIDFGVDIHTGKRQILNINYLRKKKAGIRVGAKYLYKLLKETANQL